MREKLIKLLCEVQDYGIKNTYEAWATTVEPKDNGRIADHLIANGVTIQKWIPVSERLPEEWVDVLVWSWCGFCEVAVYLGIPGKWRVIWNHDRLEDNTVTHWMPLPEPPKREE